MKKLSLILLFSLLLTTKAFANFVYPAFGEQYNRMTAPSYITGSIGVTASTETLGVSTTISSSLSGSISGPVQIGSGVQLTTTGSGSLTGTGHTLALFGRNIHNGSGALPLQIGAEGILQNTNGGAVGYGAIVAANMNSLTAGSTYTLLAGFSPIYDGIASPASITTLADFYSADHSAITNIPAARYSLLNLDAGKTIYSAGSIIALGEASIGGVSADGSGKVVCVNASGNLGTCSSVVGAGGTCTCS